MISRRNFIATSAAVSLNSLAAAPMPTRTLGRTGAKVSILAFGGGSRFLMYKDDEYEAVLNRALELGITYFDCAFGYGNGKSEERFGNVLKPHRDKIWLVTKIGDRDYDGFMRTFEGSLKRLKTDHLNLVHAHALNNEDYLAKLEDKNNGALKAMYKIREQKMTKAIGVSCHTAPNVLKSALERHDFDCTQMALNAARIGQSEPQPVSFEATALPVANKKNLGVIAMKVFGQEKLNGKASVDELIRYSLSLPVSAAVVGMPKMDMLEKNVAVAKGFQPMSPTDRDKLFGSVGQHKVAMDRFFADHIDC